mgnify:CR=1 FL=1
MRIIRILNIIAFFLLIHCKKDCLLIKFPVKLMDAEICIPVNSNCNVDLIKSDNFELEEFYYHIDSCNDLFIELLFSFPLGKLICTKEIIEKRLTDLNELNYEFFKANLDYCDESYNLYYENFIENLESCKGIKIWRRNINRSRAIIWLRKDNYIATLCINFKNSDINRIKKLFFEIEIIY